MAFLRNLLRVLGVSAAFTLVAGISLAYAGINVQDTNGTTGPFSENESIVDTNRVWDVSVNNIQDIIRDFSADVTTGGNLVDENTSVGDQLGGDVNIDITGRNSDLTNGLGIFSLPQFSISDVNITGGNGITGPNSENRNEVFANQDIRANLENRVRVNNDVNYSVSTGNNEVSDNTLVGDINTGSVNLRANLNSGVSGLNNGFVTLGNSGFIGNNDLTTRFNNLTTGPNSENTNTIEANMNIVEDISNVMEINNNLRFRVNAGNNSVSENTSVGDIRTGDVTINAMVD